jgi:hypothetical protein
VLPIEAKMSRTDPCGIAIDPRVLKGTCARTGIHRAATYPDSSLGYRTPTGAARLASMTRS